MNFAQRIVDASRVCKHMFTLIQLVKNFHRALKEATRESVRAHVIRRSASDRYSLSLFSKSEVSEGRAQREEARPESQSSKYLPTTTRGGVSKKGALAPTMYLDALVALALNVSLPTTPTTVTKPHDLRPGPRKPIESHDLISIVDTVVKLERIFVMFEEYLVRALRGSNVESRDFMRRQSMYRVSPTKRFIKKSLLSLLNIGNSDVGVAENLVARLSRVHSLA